MSRILLATNGTNGHELNKNAARNDSMVALPARNSCLFVPFVAAFCAAKKKARVPRDPGFSVVRTAVMGDDPKITSDRAAMAAAYTAGIAPTEAAYSSPHVQSELVTDHLHFSR